MRLPSNRRRFALPLAAAIITAIGAPAYAVSSGGYSSAKQGCTPNADNSDHPNRVEKYCYALTLQIADAKHTYVLIGVPQTKNNSNPSYIDTCLDFTGTMQCLRTGKAGASQFTRKGTPIDPGSAQLHVYFGADDNLDSGEHDSSEQVSNGPSDGGAIVANIDPLSASKWIANVQKGGQAYLLTHPLPAADAGFGACADGLCFSVQTQRRVAYKAGGKHPKQRDVSNYDGHTWDPITCAGPTDKPKQCGGHPLSYWHKRNQTAYVEPGVQIYEDPDPQGSPEGPYPLPAIYVGTCGLIAGGGMAPKFPASPFTNKSGQLVVSTGC